MLPVLGDLDFRLQSDGAGATNATNPLELAQEPPANDNLPNYDQDRDNRPGLSLRQTGRGLGTTDSREFQEWVIEAETHLTLAPTAKIQLWVTTFGSAPSGPALAAGLYHCAQPHLFGACAQIGVGTWQGPNNGGPDATFMPVTMTFPVAAGVSIPDDTYLILKIIAPTNPGMTGWLDLAYGSVDYPAILSFE